MPTRIEISFPFDVDIPFEVFQEIDRLITEKVCNPYKKGNPTRTMWVSGHGCKMYWSEMDAGILGGGHEVDPSIKNGDEPRISDDIYEITITEREK